MNENRIKILQKGIKKSGPVIYWMSRDQRLNDNWALIYAQQIATESKKPLAVIFNLVPDFLEATIRQYGFMLKGLQEVEENLRKKNIPFFLLEGNPSETVPKFLSETNASVLVTDFDPLKIKISWKTKVSEKIDIPFYEVDAHNIVPCRYVSIKTEFAAHTIRPKIHKHLPEFLDEIPSIKKMKKSSALTSERINWDKVKKSLTVNRDVKESTSRIIVRYKTSCACKGEIGCDRP